MAAIAARSGPPAPSPPAAAAPSALASAAHPEDEYALVGEMLGHSLRTPPVGKRMLPRRAARLTARGKIQHILEQDPTADVSDNDEGDNTWDLSKDGSESEGEEGEEQEGKGGGEEGQESGQEAAEEGDDEAEGLPSRKRKAEKQKVPDDAMNEESEEGSDQEEGEEGEGEGEGEGEEEDEEEQEEYAAVEMDAEDLDGIDESNILS